MGAFFVYVLKSALCLAVFYLFYRLLLSRETFHRFNRAALLGVLVLSAVVPLVELGVRHPLALGQGMSSLEQWLADAAPAGAVAAEGGSPQALWPLALLGLYGAGVFVVVAGYVCSLVRLGRLLRGMRREDIGRYVPGAPPVRLLVHERDLAPFSWMGRIVISRKDLEDGGRSVLLHELAHIRGGHSWDLLLADVFRAVQWFNPAAWLVKQDLRLLHEYEADEAVLGAGADARDYQLLLIRKAVGARRYSMADGFDHSKLKKRIAMMQKRKSNPWARAKCFYVLPLAAVAVTALARPEVSAVSREFSSASVGRLAAVVQQSVGEVPPQDTAGVRGLSSADKGRVYDMVEVMPEFPGGWDALGKFVKDNLRYPEGHTDGGRVIVQFVVDHDGTVADATVVRSVSPELDAEALRVVRSMPRWKPGTQDGKAVAAMFTMPILFNSGIRESFQKTDEEEHPVVVVDGKPMEWKHFIETTPTERIASITVLKGEQATAYGAKGIRSGVLVVTTKKPADGAGEEKSGQ